MNASSSTGELEIIDDRPVASSGRIIPKAAAKPPRTKSERGHGRHMRPTGSRIGADSRRRCRHLSSSVPRNRNRRRNSEKRLRHCSRHLYQCWRGDQSVRHGAYQTGASVLFVFSHSRSEKREFRVSFHVLIHRAVPSFAIAETAVTVARPDVIVSLFGLGVGTLSHTNCLAVVFG